MKNSDEDKLKIENQSVTMPELIPEGPIIPVRLMNERDSQEVVFFCGAGISIGSGLPTFSGLVRDVYEAANLHPDEVEAEALDMRPAGCPGGDRFFGPHPKFDKALGLLERGVRLGLSRLRRIVIDRLSQEPGDGLPVHEAIIGLSRTSKGTRLVTTNFDDRFARAGLPDTQTDACPKLPIPKAHGWHSLVQLHGQIVAGDDGSNLVLTSADFGRAYLTERWAARFVTELFREFTVVFVGYSLEDPVLTYIVDALAAERKFHAAYAFAAYDDRPGSRAHAENSWRAKSVEPILYNCREGHRFLNDTLVAWAALIRDPFRARVNIAIEAITKLPSGPDDPLVERVTWALQDAGAAEALANVEPIADESDFPKVEAWLEIFHATSLLSRQYRGNEASPAPETCLVGHGAGVSEPLVLDRVTDHLARWLARHIHVPQVLTWVLRKGGQLHPYLKRQVRWQLAQPTNSMPEKLRYYWTLLASQEQFDIGSQLWRRDQFREARYEAERRLLEEQTIRGLEPRLVLRPGPSSWLELWAHIDDARPPLTPVESCAHLDLSLSTEDLPDRVGELLASRETIARYADALSSYLEKALYLLGVMDERPRRSYHYRSSIAAHDQDRFKDQWTKLIDYTRDSYFALAEVNRGKAANLLDRWVCSDEPLFRRLALHAITDDSKADIWHAVSLLLKGRKPGLWDFDLHRETMRFLRMAGPRLPSKLRRLFIKAIKEGPKPGSRRDDPDYKERQIALRLHKLNVSGVKLNKRDAERAAKAAPVEGRDEERDEFLSWIGEGRWGTPQDEEAQQLLGQTLHYWIVALEREAVAPESFREFLATTRPKKVAAALRRLAKEGHWPAQYWKGLFSAISLRRHQQKSNTRLLHYVTATIQEAPDEWYAAVVPGLADFVEELAAYTEPEDEGSFHRVWMKAWSSLAEEQEIKHDDPLNQALNHPAGRLAEAALHRLWKYEPKARGGLPEPVRQYLDAIAQDPEGHLGRVWLMTQLHSLFLIDSEWTKANLLSQLSPAASRDVQDLWFAYAWSPRLGPDLLMSFKDSFLEILRSEKVQGRAEGNLIAVFVDVCLEEPDAFTSDEIRSVVGCLSEGGLVWTLRRLEVYLKGDAATRASVWRERIQRWLETYWPNEGARNTDATSRGVLDLLSKTGDAFPEAAAWSNPFLRHLSGGLYELTDSKIALQFPHQCLSLLDTLVNEQVLEAIGRRELGKIVDQIAEVWPDATQDPVFQNLRRISLL